MKVKTIRCQLGPTSATLVTNSESVLTYLENFYALTEDSADGDDWIVEAIVGPADGSMATNPWGVSYAVPRGSRRLRLRSSDPHSLAITTRKCVREALVDYCEQRRYAMLHASAVFDEHRVIIFVGDKGSGKTTLALKLALSTGMRYLSNDHLIMFADSVGDAGRPEAAQLVLTSLPTPIPLKIGTYLDLEEKLPPPWDCEDTDIDAHRDIPRAQLYGLDRRVLYTFPRLGHASPAQARLGVAGHGPAVLVVLASYRHDGEPQECAVDNPITSLMPHVRTDWMFDPSLNQRLLPRQERTVPVYTDDALRLLDLLAQRASAIVGWSHRGDPAALLNHPDLKVKTP